MKCKTRRCSNEAAPYRKVCYKCKSKAWREKNPIAFMWHNLKKSAKKRGLPFTLTLEFFTELAVTSGYHEQAGRASDSLTIDRINNLRGYEPDNVRVITKSENSSKFHQEDECRYVSDDGSALIMADSQPLPF